MYVEALEEKYAHLKSEFPQMFIFLFSMDGQLNDFGKMADELYHFRHPKPEKWALPSIRDEKPLDCVASDHCKTDVRR